MLVHNRNSSCSLGSVQCPGVLLVILACFFFLIFQANSSIFAGTADIAISKTDFRIAPQKSAVQNGSQCFEDGR
jgi:hypothetical protein